MCFAFAIGTFSFFCQHTLTKIDNYWTWLSLPLFRNNIVAIEIIVDESAAMNRLPGSFYFSENSTQTCFWRPPILKSLARKITYRLFDTNIFKEASTLEWWLWTRRTSSESSAKSRAHRQGSRSRITAQSNLVVGHGEGRATPELDLIWWSNLYNCINEGKLAIWIYVSRMVFSWLLCNQHWTVSLNLLKMLPDNRIVQNVTPMYNTDGMKLLILIHLKPHNADYCAHYSSWFVMKQITNNNFFLKVITVNWWFIKLHFSFQIYFKLAWDDYSRINHIPLDIHYP